MTTDLAELPDWKRGKEVQQQHEQDGIIWDPLPLVKTLFGTKVFMAARLEMSWHSISLR
jgi:SpoVK/Ycf46/Vps4 family AAA+-type ATPase